MAVARDAVSGISETGSSTTHSFSHTCTGSNLYLLVGVADWSGDNVTGVTYNGVSMTQLVKETRNPDSGSLEIYFYGLANPSTGTNTVTITRSSSSLWIDGCAVSYTGVTQTTSPVDATGTAQGDGSSSTTVNITTVANNTAVVTFGVSDNASIAASTNLTEIANSVGLPSGNDCTILCEASSFPVTPAGAKSYTISHTSTAGDAHIAVSLAPAGGVAAVAVVPTLLTLGVG